MPLQRLYNLSRLYLRTKNSQNMLIRPHQHSLSLIQPRQITPFLLISLLKHKVDSLDNYVQRQRYVGRYLVKCFSYNGSDVIDMFLVNQNRKGIIAAKVKSRELFLSNELRWEFVDVRGINSR